MTPKRQAVQDYVIKTIRMLDDSGYNLKLYKDFFDNMSDEAFDKWMRTLRDNKHAKMTFMVPPLKVVINLDNAIKVAKFLGVELMERIRLWDPIGKRYCLTPEKYFILRLHIRE